MQTHVTFTRREEIGWLTFVCDEAQKPPTLDHQVLDELAAHLATIAAEHDRLRAVILRSDAQKYFVVGANLAALATLDATTIVPWVQKGHQVFNRLAELPLPVIAWVDGYALGGGLEMILACDMIVAGYQAKFGQPEASLGLVPGWGGSRRLPRRVGPSKAKELFFTGKVLDADTALAIGLVDFVGDERTIGEFVDSLLADIRRCSPLAIAQTKQLIDRGSAMSEVASSEAEAVASSLCLADPDTQQRVAHQLQRRHQAHNQTGQSSK